MPATLRSTLFLFAAVMLGASTQLMADEPQQPVGHYRLPEDGDVIGQIQHVTATQEDTLLDIGRRYGLGYEEMRRANPTVNMWVPGEGTEVVLPTRFILPDAPRKGIVVNVAEMRLYYYPPRQAGEPAMVETYPISVGRQDWTTPLGETHIVTKVKDPAWYPPASIRKEHAENGQPLPSVVPAGPDNPLGQYAMRLNIPGYLIHGTNRPLGIGMRATHGCVRMYPEDIESLFARVPVNTPVRLINEPLQVGWSGDTLYVQAFPQLQEDHTETFTRFLEAMDKVTAALGEREVKVDYDLLYSTIEAHTGIPVPLATPQENPTATVATGAPTSRNGFSALQADGATGE